MKRFAERFFRWFCHPGYYAEIQGDLEEMYQRDIAQSKRSARWNYLLRVLGLFRPTLIRSLSEYSLTNPDMFRHYFNISTRVLLKHKLYAAINILGLAVGMGVCLLIYQYIHFELSYDQFHADVLDTYRLTRTITRNGEHQGTGVYTTYALGPLGKETIPEVEEVVRIRPDDVGMVVTNPERNEPYQEHGIWYVDSSFFRMFDFPLRYGDQKSALANQYSMVVTQSMAQKYFGNENPVGKTLSISAGTLSGDFTVTGVLQALPENSHLQFDFLLPMRFLLEHWGPYQKEEGWGWDDFVTYITLNEAANLGEVGEKFDQLVTTHVGEELGQSNTAWNIGFQALTDIHLKSDFPEDLANNHGSMQHVRFFAIIGLFILFIAWINYINLSTARALHRAKEVGVRKSVGALKTQLIGQFMIESALINGLAVLLALGIALLMLPALNTIIGKELSLAVLHQLDFWGGAVLVVMLGTLLSGLYPAFVLSSFKPVRALKSAYEAPRRGLSLRKGLITFQFLISVLLISGTYLVYQQVTFMKNQDLGFNIEKIVVINGPRVAINAGREVLFSKYRTFKNEVVNHHTISAVSMMSQIPTRGYMGAATARRVGEPESAKKASYAVIVDTSFTDAYDIEFLARKEFPNEIVPYRWLIINEEAVDVFGLGSPQEAIGEKLLVFGDTSEILGVVQNVHWSSLKDAHRPILFSLDNEYGAYFSIKTNLSDIPETIAHIEAAYKSVFPNDPFYYFFLDDSFNQQYQADLQFGNLFSAFSALAIFIACIGLFALVSFSATLRTKEIGIRKVLGATVSNLMVLLSREYLLLLLVASIIAVPVIILGGKAWLDNYAYKVGMDAGLFLIPALVLFVIALLTVSYRTYTAARANPVESLKTE